MDGIDEWMECDGLKTCMASGPRSDFTWMERCLRSRDFDVGIESSEASNSAVNLSQVEIIRDLCFKDDFQVLGQATKKRTLYHYHHHLASKTRRAPWTPLPRRLGAYSERSTWRNHSITLRITRIIGDDKDVGLVCDWVDNYVNL